MNLLTIVALVVSLLSIQYDAASSTLPKSPWAEPVKARLFMSCLTEKIADPNILSLQEKEDLQSIVETLMSAIEGTNARGKSSDAQLQAIDMAIASSLAEIVIADGGTGIQANITVKTQVLSSALEQCFESVLGRVDRKFISEIKDLIPMFVKEAASEVDEEQAEEGFDSKSENEEETEQGDFDEAGLSVSLSVQTRSQSDESTHNSDKALIGIDASETNHDNKPEYPEDRVLRPTSIDSEDQISQPISVGIKDRISQPISVGIKDQISQPISVGIKDRISQPISVGIKDRISQPISVGIEDQISQPKSIGIGNKIPHLISNSIGDNISKPAANALIPQLKHRALGNILRKENRMTDTSTGRARNRVSQHTVPISPYPNRSYSSSFKTKTQSDSNTHKSNQTFQGFSEMANGYRRTYPRKYSGSQDFKPFSHQISQTEGSGVGNQISSTTPGLISRVSKALANSSTLRKLLRSGVRLETDSNLINRTFQSLAVTLGIDGNELSETAVQTISQLPPGSDIPDYAQALSSVLVTSGIINERNVNSVGPKVLSAVLKGLSSDRKGLAINLGPRNVQNGVLSRKGSKKPSSPLTSFSKATTSITSGAPSTSYTGEHISGRDARILNGPVKSTVDSLDKEGTQDGLISRVTKALANSSTVRTLLRKGTPPRTASYLMQRTIQSLARSLGVDRNNLNRRSSQVISHLPPGCDTSDYAEALSNVLVNSGILNKRNIDSLGPRVLSSVFKELSSTGKRIGINVDTGKVENDIRATRNFLKMSSSSTSFSQKATSITIGDISTSNSGEHIFKSDTGTLSGPIPSNVDFLVKRNPNVDSLVKRDPNAGLISRMTNLLLSSPPIKTSMERGIPPQTSFNLMQRTIQSLVSDLGIDENNLDMASLQSFSQVAPGSGFHSYARALSTALVTNGIVNERNIDYVGPKVLDAFLKGLTNGGQHIGINVESDVQNDVNLNGDFLTRSSLSSSLSQKSTSTTSEAISRTVSYPNEYSSVPDVGTLSAHIASNDDSLVKIDPNAGLISRVKNTLMNFSPITALLKRNIPPKTASNLTQRMFQSLANNLGIDLNNLDLTALQSTSQLAPGSDFSSYAIALSTALVNNRILTERNIEYVGPRVFPALLKGLENVDINVDINIDTDIVPNDIRYNSDFLTNSLPSFSQSADSTIDGGTLKTNEYSEDSYDLEDGLLNSPVTLDVDSLIKVDIQDELISRVTSALENSWTLKEILGKSVSPEMTSYLIQRTIQSLPNSRGINGNNLERTALKAISQLSPGSDTSSYAEALSIALVTSGILNESNIDFEGPRVLSAFLKGLSNTARSLDINVDAEIVLNDIQSSSNLLPTRYSSTSVSQTVASPTSKAVSATGGYPERHLSRFDARTLSGPIAPTVDLLAAGSRQTGLISRVKNVLANSPALKVLLKGSIPPKIASNIIQRSVQPMCNTLGVDGNNLSRRVSQVISQRPLGSVTPDYAEALSTALVNSGILNERNIDTVGSRILSDLLKGLIREQKAIGINVDNENVHNDIRSSSNFQTTSSSLTSFSETGDSVIRESTSTTGDYFGEYPSESKFGTLNSPVGETADVLIEGDQQAELISRVKNALANSSTLKEIFRGGIPSKTASNLIQRAIQPLVNDFGADGNNLSRTALQAISQLSPESDTPDYAQAISTALVTSGILNERNVDSAGPRILSSFLNELSDRAQDLDINVDLDIVQNDDTAYSGDLVTLHSSSSLSKTEDNVPTISIRGEIGSLVNGNQFRPFDQISEFSPSSLNEADFTLPSGFLSSGMNQGGFGEPSGVVSLGVGPLADISVLPTLNSPNGLKSGSAEPRISQMALSILNAITPGGINDKAFANILQASISNLKSSGMSSGDAKIEVLLETIVGLLQLLSNAQVWGFDRTTASSVMSSATKSFELALA